MTEYQNFRQQIQFSEDEKKLLQQYYYANTLLIDCLNSGCEVSDSVRNIIEQTLLLPLSEIENKKHTS